MRHGKTIRKFGRETKQRTAFIRSLAVSLIEHGKITTTETRAKELRPMVERLITRGKAEKSIASRRIVRALLPKKSADKIFSELGPRFASRNGGYTRITKLSPRASDGARMAVIELTE